MSNITDIVSLRGRAPARVNAHEDLELVGIRHREFRRAPNPPAEKFAKYKATIEKAARFVAFNPKYQAILNVSQHEFGDLYTYCLAWTTNFCAPVLAETDGIVRLENDSKGKRRLYVVGPGSRRALTVAQGDRVKKLLALAESDNIHEAESALEEARKIAGNVDLLSAVGHLTKDKTLFVREGEQVRAGQALMNGYELPPQRDRNNDNIKLLYTHLVQRLLEFIGILYRRFYHHAPDKVAAQDFSFSQFTASAAHVLDEEDEDADYVASHRQISTGSETARKRSAKKLLDEELARLPHDRMVETLESAAANLAICPDARGHAARRLKAHKETCGQCNLHLVEPQREVLVLPQADSLIQVRGFAAAMVARSDDFEKSGTVRHRNFYRQAARVLLLANIKDDESFVPTRHSHELLKTEAGSQGERDFFRGRIEDSPTLKPYSWFFSDPDVPKNVLVADIVKRTGLSETTSKRRAVTLIQWKLYTQAA